MIADVGVAHKLLKTLKNKAIRFQRMSQCWHMHHSSLTDKTQTHCLSVDTCTTHPLQTKHRLIVSVLTHALLIPYRQNTDALSQCWHMHHSSLTDKTQTHCLSVDTCTTHPLQTKHRLIVSVLTHAPLIPYRQNTDSLSQCWHMHHSSLTDKTKTHWQNTDG